MIIRRGSFLYLWAYWGCNDRKIPAQVNLCGFFWRCVRRLVPNLFMIILMIVLVGLFIPIATIVGGIVGYRLALLRSDPERGQLFIPIEHLPIIKGVRLKPVHILAPAMIIWLVTMIPGQLIGDGLLSAWTILCSKWVTLAIVGNLCFIGCIISWKRWIRDSQVVELCRAHAKAQKEKFCPMIRIE